MDPKARQTPASCQSRSRRQHLMPEPQPISRGSNSYMMPVISANMMPVNQARSGTRGRPPLGLGGSGGSSGATMAHNSSLTRGSFIPQGCHNPFRFCSVLLDNPEQRFLGVGALVENAPGCVEQQ